MYIKNLSFTDKASNWILKHIEFDQLSLLVGLSGVGKTRILNAIDCLEDLASGKSFNGIKWKINFLDDKGNNITWSGETEYNKTSIDKRQCPMRLSLSLKEEDKPNAFPFIEEKILINDAVEAQRKNNGDIIFQRKKTVKLPKEQSLIFLLKEEDAFAIISKSLSKILMLASHARFSGVVPALSINEDDPDTLPLIQKAQLTTSHKLLLAANSCKEVFQEIKDDFKEVFPFVEDMRFSPPEFQSVLSKNPLFDMQVLQIKEKKVDNWIHPWQLSSGMNKVLMLLASVYLSPIGSVLLIDEFENSYGTNCLTPIVDYISSKNSFQFIMTSHHPYIVGNIDPKQWLLITRKANVIEAKKIDSELSATSRHDKFLQLINLQDFYEGITS